MTETGLEYIVYNQSSAENDAELGIKAISGNLTPEDAKMWRGLVHLSPMPGDANASEASVGLFAGLGDDLILARARYVIEDDIHDLVHQYIALPRAILQSLSSNLHLLIELTQQAFDNIDAQFNDNDAMLTIAVPDAPTLVAGHGHSILERLLETYNYPMPFVLSVLDAALSPQRVLLSNGPETLNARLDVIEGVMALLPGIARPYLTFATHVDNPQRAKTRIIFADASTPGERRIIDLSNVPDDLEFTYTNSYVQMLAELWRDDLAAFLNDLRAIGIVAGQMMPSRPLLDGLNNVTVRHRLNLMMMTEAEVPIEQVTEALSGDFPPLEDMQTHYIQRLLAYALEEREQAAVELIASYMDQKPAIEAYVLESLRDLVETSPDDVYFFIRSRLSASMDPQLLPILHQCAQQALQVALDDDSTETLMTWLNLIAREPADYLLADVLKTGIHDVQVHARTNGELGQDLLLFVAKRAPSQIDTLLADAALFNTLAAPVGPALRMYEPEAVNAVFEQGREIALVMLSRAAQAAETNAQAAAVFDDEAVDYLWAYYANGKYGNLPVSYQPDYVLNLLIDAGDTWLSEAAADVLLKRIISVEDADHLTQFAAQITDKYDLSAMLVNSFQVNATEASAVLSLVGLIQQTSIITAQDALNIIIQLAANRDWSDSTRPLVERASRMLQQDADLTVALNALWQMLRISSGENKMDAVANVVARRTVTYVTAVEDEAELVEMLLRLHQRLAWSKSLRMYLLSWWREFIREQPLARVQQLDRILSGKKELAEERAILQTTIAVRRMMGQRSLSEFAQDITTTYNLLQAFSESFDPNHRTITQFDQPTVRAELDAPGSELSGDERQVLAKNLKELAQLIIAMSDQRSKPAIMRREEDVERQLITGDQLPQSGIDTMRWLSGYLNGSQPSQRDSEDE